MSYETKRPPIAVILAANTESGFSPKKDTAAKSLLSVGGTVILERVIRNCLSCGISQFVVVLGHRADDIQKFVDKTFRGIRVTYVLNERYSTTNTGYSLLLAAPAIGMADFVKFDAGVVFDTKILRHLMDSDHPSALCIDRNAAARGNEVTVTVDENKRVTHIGQTLDAEAAMGRSIGIEKISSKTGKLIFSELESMMDNPAHTQDRCEAAYAILAGKGAVFHALDITGLGWTQVENEEDFVSANAMFTRPFMTMSRGQQKALDDAKERGVTPL
jgi:choline kinase